MPKFDLIDCDEWCTASSVSSKSAVKTFGFVVENFTNVIKSGSTVKSSQFEIDGTKWSIKIHGDGEDITEKGFVAMCLCNDNDETYKVDARISACGKTFKLVAQGIEKEVGWGRRKMVSHADCIKDLVKGKLYVKAEVAVIKRDEIKLLSGRGEGVSWRESDVSELVNRILTNKVCPDFKLVSNGMKFDVHKNFIAAQSETLQNAVERWSADGRMFLDEYRPEVVRNLINYFYRKQLEEEVFKDNVAEFLNIGEKYDLPKLKSQAELCMITNLSKETFIDYLIAGDLFKAAKLKEATLKFIAHNKNLWNGNSVEMKEKFEGKKDLLMEIITALTTTA